MVQAAWTALVLVKTALLVTWMGPVLTKTGFLVAWMASVLMKTGSVVTWTGLLLTRMEPVLAWTRAVAGVDGPRYTRAVNLAQRRRDYLGRAVILGTAIPGLLLILFTDFPRVGWVLVFGGVGVATWIMSRRVAGG